MAATAIECPYCEQELLIPEDSLWYTCPHCQHGLNARAQRAYARGREWFFSEQEAGAGLYGVRRRGYCQPEEVKVLRAFQRAHSALQEALRIGLAESQREAAVEMMAEITRLFAHRQMISGLEARYWAQLVVEQNSWREYGALEQRLAQPRKGGLLSFLRHWRWQLRRRQLARALSGLDRQIQQLEEMIGFVDPPRARAPRP